MTDDEKLKQAIENELAKFGDSITPEERETMRKKMHQMTLEGFEAGYAEGYSAAILMDKLGTIAIELYLPYFLKLPEVVKYQAYADIRLEDHKSLLTALMKTMFLKGTRVYFEYAHGKTRYDELVTMVKETNE